MKAIFSFDELIEATNAEVIKEPQEEMEGYKISTDTRSIGIGDVFLPLVGPSFDGHNFISNAMQKGALGCFVDKNHDSKEFISERGFILQVDDTLKALLSLASYYRETLGAIVVALTGSSGKTTTKEIIYSVLAEKFNVQRSQMNYNNEIGVSKTLLEVDEETEIVILEMGMRGLGEIDLLCKYAKPDIAIVTNVGTSHIGRLGSVENIAIAKTEILNYLDKQTGMAFLYADDKLLLEYAKKNYKGKKVLFGSQKNCDLKSCTKSSMQFSYKDEEYELPIPGHHNIINASVAIELAKELCMSYEDIYNGLKSYKPLFGRWEEMEVFRNSKLINDAYNSNPDSAKAAISTVLNLYNDKDVWLVLGDMLELGDYEETMHRDLGNWLKEKKVKAVVSVGDRAKSITDQLEGTGILLKTFTDSSMAGEYVVNEAPEDTVILLKASRGVGLEKIVERIKNIEGGNSH